MGVSGNMTGVNPTLMGVTCCGVVPAETKSPMSSSSNVSSVFVAGAGIGGVGSVLLFCASITWYNRFMESFSISSSCTGLSD